MKKKMSTTLDKGIHAAAVEQLGGDTLSCLIPGNASQEVASAYPGCLKDVLNLNSCLLRELRSTTRVG
jgi:hypothetical protein